MYPMRENETQTNYIRRVKIMIDSDYKEKNNANSRINMKKKYNTDVQFKEYQKSNALDCYHCY